MTQADCLNTGGKGSPFLHTHDPRRKGGVSLCLYLQLITKQKYEDKVFSEILPHNLMIRGVI